MADGQIGDPPNLASERVGILQSRTAGRHELAVLGKIELGVAITAYGVLSRGLISGHWSPERQAQTRDFRSHLPRFQNGNLTANLALVDALKMIAAEKGATAAQVAIAWVRAKADALGTTIVPLIGARNRERLAESLGAATVALSSAEVGRLEAALSADAVRGTRYPAEQMRVLDSER